VPSAFVSLRIDEELLDRYRSLAEDEDRSVSSTIRQALRRNLDEHEQDHAPEQGTSQEGDRAL
jgi:predicted transcriptional regulator